MQFLLTLIENRLCSEPKMQQEVNTKDTCQHPPPKKK